MVDHFYASGPPEVERLDGWLMTQDKMSLSNKLILLIKTKWIVNVLLGPVNI